MKKYLQREPNTKGISRQTKLMAKEPIGITMAADMKEVSLKIGSRVSA